MASTSEPVQGAKGQRVRFDKYKQTDDSNRADARLNRGGLNMYVHTVWGCALQQKVTLVVVTVCAGLRT